MQGLVGRELEGGGGSGSCSGWGAWRLRGKPGQFGRLLEFVQLYRLLHSCKSEGVRGVSGQPGGQFVRALEVEQDHSCGEGFAYGQGFQLLQGQGLDLDVVGVCERNASAIPYRLYRTLNSGGSSRTHRSGSEGLPLE